MEAGDALTDESVEVLLTERFDGMVAQLDEGLVARVPEVAEVRRVDLCVSVELTKVLVNGSRVEKGCKPASEVLRQACTLTMEDIQMIFKCVCVTRKVRRSDDNCDDSSSLFL